MVITVAATVNTVAVTVNTVADTVNTVADTGITFKSLQNSYIIGFDTYSKQKRLYEEAKPELERRRLASLDASEDGNYAAVFGNYVSHYGNYVTHQFEIFLSPVLYEKVITLKCQAG